jgi:hypothetical protein
VHRRRRLESELHLHPLEVLDEVLGAADEVDLAVAVFVETGVSGSQTAGPVLEAFLR